VGVGIIGYGMMGKAHSYGYTLAPLIRELPCRPRLRMISGRHRTAVESAARAYGVEQFVTDWREIIDSPAIDVVDVCTPPGSHPEIVEAAAEAGKAILCEKPLAADYAGAHRAADAIRRADVPNAICFNYRRLPALALMKNLVDAGRVGTVRLWRATWLSDEFLDPQTPFDWRFDRKQGASTVADLGAHLIDLAQWIVGDVNSVSAQSTTFTRARRDAEISAEREVDVEDASAALLRFENAALGVLETAKVCPGRPCDFTVEVTGSRGSLRFDYARLNELWYATADDPPELYGVRRIRTEHPVHPETKGWWPVGQGIGYEASFVNQAADLLEQWPSGTWTPDVAVGLKVQAVCEAIEQSAADARPVAVQDVIEHAAV
ncbi:MAG: Gfo/Idh/MocA family oxidoreductase, partial [Solirubrobacterales bacterium]|nr:Gfo/Idh/MocA family oxidoreductase [Solirubrobacterales bacterium]